MVCGSGLLKLEQWLARAAQQGMGEHEVEGHLFREMLALGAQLLGAFLETGGTRRFGRRSQAGRGTDRETLAKATRTTAVDRVRRIPIAALGVWGSSRPEIELVPTDQRLQLPEGDLSYLLQEWDQLLGTEQAFGLVRDTWKRSWDSANRSIRWNAVVARWPRRPRPSASRSLLPSPKMKASCWWSRKTTRAYRWSGPWKRLPRAAIARRARRPTKSRWPASVCVYTVDPHLRTAEGVVATLFRDPDRPREKPPQARHKRYWTALSREEGGHTVRAQDEVFQHFA